MDQPFVDGQLSENTRAQPLVIRAQPLVIAVSGMPGAGSSTLASALADRFGVVAAVGGMDPPDFAIRVIGAQVRARDRAAIDATQVPLLVVAGKSDTRPDAERMARTASRALGQAVIPVSGLLAGVRLDATDRDILGQWRDAGIAVPTSAAAFAAADEVRGDAPQQQARARMMALLGRTGLVAALEVLEASPDATVAEVNAALHRRSGVDALVTPIKQAAGAIAAGRRVRRLAGLRLLSARGFDRPAIEQRLITESAR